MLGVCVHLCACVYMCGVHMYDKGQILLAQTEKISTPNKKMITCILCHPL